MSHAKGRVAHASSRYSDYAGWYEMQARHCMPAHTVQHRVDGISNLAERDTAVTLLVPADKPNGGLHRQGSSSSASAPSTPVGASPRLTRPSPARDVDDQEFENAMTVMLQELDLVGELLREVGSPEGCGGWIASTEAELDALLQRMTARVAITDAASMTVLRRRRAADVLFRTHAGKHPAVEVRVAIIGNVDSGKSTMVGVLTRSMLDDGRGLARSKVFRHGHEEATGRTSSIGQHNLCLDADGGILNDASFRTNTCGDYVSRASKVLTLVDLAGHERYFKTTAYGLTGYLPDYCCLIVGANAGLVGMCKEHLGVALALKVPVFFVVTKIDIAPEHVLKNTVSSLIAVLKKPGVRKKPLLIRTVGDVITAARHMQNEAIAPIILTSSVSGEGLDLVRLMFNLLPQRHNWPSKYGELAEFIIDETFGVPGVGTVVAGTVKRGVIRANTQLLLGPDVGDGSFKPTAIKSIHYKRVPVTTVVAGQTAALALKKVKRSAVRKGMVLVDEGLHPRASWEFDADIAILTHTTTIQPRYQAVIHCEIVRQAAQVVNMDQEFLRSGDRARVRFRFLQRPEYLTPGARFVFREGRTKGIGVIVGACDSE